MTASPRTTVTATAPPVTTAGAVLVRRLSFVLALGLIGSVPIEDARTVAGHSLARLVGVLAFGATIVLVALERRVRVVVPVAGAGLAFVGWATLSFYWTDFPNATLAYIVTALQLLALLFVVWQNLRSPRDLRSAMIALAVGGSVGGLMSILSHTAKHGGAARYAVGDPNDFGVMCAITAVVTMHLLRTAPRPAAKLVYGAALVLQVVAVARTGSRTALIAGVLAAVVLVTGRGSVSPRRIATALLALGVSALGVHLFVAGDTLARLGTAFSAAESGDLNNRTAAWIKAFDVWRHDPVLGAGAGAFRHLNPIGDRAQVAHSILFGLLAELGLVGLGLFVAVVVTAARQLRRASPAERRLWLALLVAWLGAAFTLTFELRKMTWVLIALAAAHALTGDRATSGSRRVVAAGVPEPGPAGAGSRPG